MTHRVAFLTGLDLPLQRPLRPTLIHSLHDSFDLYSPIRTIPWEEPLQFPIPIFLVSPLPFVSRSFIGCHVLGIYDGFTYLGIHACII